MVPSLFMSHCNTPSLCCEPQPPRGCHLFVNGAHEQSVNGHGLNLGKIMIIREQKHIYRPLA